MDDARALGRDLQRRLLRARHASSSSPSASGGDRLVVGARRSSRTTRSTGSGIEDTLHREPATGKIRDAIGWQPTLDLDAILADVIEHQRAQPAPALERRPDRPAREASRASRPSASSTRRRRPRAAPSCAAGSGTSLSFALPQVYTVVISIAAARFLGPAGFGRQSYIAFVSLSLSTLLSSSMYVARDALRRRERRAPGRAARSAGLLVVGVAGRGRSPRSLAARPLGGRRRVRGATPQGAWALAGVDRRASTILQTVPTAVLIGLQRFRQASVVGLVTGFFGTVATTLVLWRGGGITGMFAVEAVVAGGEPRSGRARSRARDPAPARRADAGRPSELRRKVGRYALAAAVGVLLELRRRDALGVLLPEALLDRRADRVLLDRVRLGGGAEARALGARRHRRAGVRDALRRRADGPRSAPATRARSGCSSSSRCR